MVTEFKDIVERWAKSVGNLNGNSNLQLTEQEIIDVNNELNRFIGCIDFNKNNIQFDKLNIRIKKLNDNEHRISFVIDCIKRGNEQLIVDVK